MGPLQLWLLVHQLSRFAVQDIETVEGLLYFTPSGPLRLNENYHNHPESRDVLERLLEVCSPDGTVLYRNDRLGGRRLGGVPLPNEGVNGIFGASRLWIGNQSGRRSTSRLQPLEQIAFRAQQITAENLHERLPVENPADEVGHLARVFNNVLARLEASFERLQRFTSDTSHELRTPLAAIRSVGEVGLQKSKTAADYQDTIGSMLEEVNRLTRLVENLLAISRADAGQLQLGFGVVSPLEIVREVASVLDLLVEEKALALAVTGDEPTALRGDRLLLRGSRPGTFDREMSCGSTRRRN